MPLRILYIVGEYPSVSETFIEREIQGLRALGADVAVCPLVPFRPAHALRSALGDLRTARHALAGSAQASIADRAKTWVRILAALPEARRAQHVHSAFLGLPATVAHGLARALRVPYSLSSHARDIHVVRTPPEVVAGAAFRTVCTEAKREALRERYPGIPFELIRHGMAPACPARAHSSEPFHILAVGRCVEKKGFTYLIEACAMLARDGLPFTCELVGEGPLLPDLRSQAAPLGRVRFCGARPNDEVIRAYACADVLVVPSVTAADGDQDGLPNVVLEAMAHAVPVVATDAGAIPEAVVHNVTGLLVAQRDPCSLAGALARVSSDPPLRALLAAGATSMLVERFAPGYWLERLHGLFLDCQR